MDEVLLSLCIPTNGIAEWVLPVIDSIYRQAADLRKFEVVVTNNGKDTDFHNKMIEYTSIYSNFVYAKNDSVGFTNQIECFKLAKGKLIKFVNHRMLLNKGTLDYLISFVEKYKEYKPVVYFSNGELMLSNEKKQFDEFETFMRVLGYWSSWSAGVAVWKKDLERINFTQKYSDIFPHTIFLFCNTQAELYIIDDKPIFTEIVISQNKKGKYNIFYAFAVEYPNILMRLCVENKISITTFLQIKNRISNLLSSFYVNYVIRKIDCSYSVDDYRKYISVYFGFIPVILRAPLVIISNNYKSIIKRLKSK